MRRKVGDAIADYYPKIIDADLHANAVLSMARRKRRVAGRGRRLVNLLAGLAVCERCGSRMTFRSKGRKLRADGSMVNEDYLICDNYQRGMGCANGRHFNYSVWESGILDAILLDALKDRHFSSPEVIRPLEVELAERVRRRTIDTERSETALSLFIETQRLEVKALWTVIVAALDENDVAIMDLQARIRTARGTVSLEEHRRRIYALRDTLNDHDERVRFETRSRIMDAAHELITSMMFSDEYLLVTITTRAAVKMQVTWEDWGGDQKGTTVAKFMPELVSRASPAQDDEATGH